MERRKDGRMMKESSRDTARMIRQKQRERQVRIRLGILSLLAVVLVIVSAQFLFTGEKSGPKTEKNAKTDTKDKDATEETSAKAAGKKTSVLETMDVTNLSQKDWNAIQKTKVWKSIMENTAVYSQDIREGLRRNPEIIQFLMDYPDAERKVNGGITKKEKKQEFPLFIQWDQRWGYVPYGSDVIGIAGCGPTCMSMVIYGLTRDAKATPDAIAKFSMDNGYYVPGTGTSWTLMTDIAPQYGLRSQQIPFAEETMKAELDQGHPLVVSLGPGDFTDHGHFIVIKGYNEEGFQVNDPFSYSNSKKTWTYERLYDQILSIWSYSK